MTTAYKGFTPQPDGSLKCLSKTYREGETYTEESAELCSHGMHACLEPMTATARVQGDKAEIWAPVQSTTLAVMGVARALDIDEADVTVYPTLLGGGFGRKFEVDAVVQAAS